MAKELYVGHISEQATEEDLRKLFEIMGVVTSVHLIVDEATGEFKRCGYVRMLSEVDLNEVVETLDGTYLVDRCIVVSIAKPQKDRPAKTPFVKRAPKGTARPQKTTRTASGEKGNENRRQADTKLVSNSHKTEQESTKTGRSSAAKDAAKKFRPKTVAGKESVTKVHTDSSAKKTSRPTARTTDKRRDESFRPSGKGRK